MDELGITDKELANALLCFVSQILRRGIVPGSAEWHFRRGTPEGNPVYVLWDSEHRTPEGKLTYGEEAGTIRMDSGECEIWVKWRYSKLEQEQPEMESAEVKR